MVAEARNNFFAIPCEPSAFSAVKDFLKFVLFAGGNPQPNTFHADARRESSHCARSLKVKYCECRARAKPTRKPQADRAEWSRFSQEIGSEGERLREQRPAAHARLRAGVNRSNQQQTRTGAGLEIGNQQVPAESPPRSSEHSAESAGEIPGASRFCWDYSSRGHGEELFTTENTGTRRGIRGTIFGLVLDILQSLRTPFHVIVEKVSAIPPSHPRVAVSRK